jgi:hypothetical protein
MTNATPFLDLSNIEAAQARTITLNSLRLPIPLAKISFHVLLDKAFWAITNQEIIAVLEIVSSDTQLDLSGSRR